MSTTGPRRALRKKSRILEALRRSPPVGADLDLGRPREEGRTPTVVPNAKTVEAMKAARQGDLVTVGGADDLLPDLHTDD